MRGLAGVFSGGAAAGGGTGQKVQRVSHLGRGVRIPHISSEQALQNWFVCLSYSLHDFIIMTTDVVQA